MRRIVTTCLTLVAAALLVLPAAATAAPKKGPVPEITRVQPMRISVGGLLTIKGRRFKTARTKNTVVFRASDGRTAFVKPRRATTTKLVLRIPASVARLLKVSGSRQQPTRLKLRVLAGKFSKYTPKRLSPVVTGAGSGDGPGGGGGGGTVEVCDNDADHDNDLLSNSDELTKYGTDPCLADTDNDGMSDGWEVYSAQDLNVKAVPYPDKRPFPNALDPSDGGPAGARSSAYDFDGDGLTTLEEYRAWRNTGSKSVERAGAPALESPLGYSDGTKYSRAWDPTEPAPTYDLHGDVNVHTDDERDADADALGNILESARGPGHYTWWVGFWKQEALQIEPWKKKSYCGQSPGDYDQRPFADLDLTDPDVDGDELLDGQDDQDNDDYNNIIELYEVYTDVDGTGDSAWCGKAPGAVPSIQRGGVEWAVNAFNPCVPDNTSRTCPEPNKPFE